MLSAAQEVAAAIEKASGLPTTAGLDDRLLNSLVIISANSKLRKPGQWFEYLGDDGAKRVLRTKGVMEFVLEIPPGERSIRARLIVVRLKQSPIREHEEFVSERLQPPFSDELQRVFEKLAETVSRLGYSLVAFGDSSGA
jgi:hypothetical protein